VVAANLVERAWAVMDRGMPYVICDIDGRPVTPEEAKAVIAENWTVPADVRAGAARRRGRHPRSSSQDDPGHALEAQGTGRPSPASIVDRSRQPRQVNSNTSARKKNRLTIDPL
jgi:hypothetical protein